MWEYDEYACQNFPYFCKSVHECYNNLFFHSKKMRKKKNLLFTTIFEMQPGKAFTILNI